MQVEEEVVEQLLENWYDGRETIIGEFSRGFRDDYRVLNRQWHEYRRLFGLPKQGAPTWRRGMQAGGWR